METNQEVARTLSRIAAILQIAHRDAIAELRDELMQDDVTKAIFDGTSTWAPRAALEKTIVPKLTSSATFKRRLTELLGRGLLERREAGSAVEYRSSGLF